MQHYRPETDENLRQIQRRFRAINRKLERRDRSRRWRSPMHYALRSSGFWFFMAIIVLFILLSMRGEIPSFAQKWESFVKYSNCASARAAGAAPLYRGQPGYSENLDADNDGIACEPLRR